MAFSSRFAVAVHVAALLASCPETCFCSEKIAESVNTNPVVIRRLLSQLKKAKIVTARRGQSGGAVLARPAASITLFDILCAVEPDLAFALHLPSESSKCKIAQSISSVISKASEQVEGAIHEALGAVTLSKVVTKCKKS